MGTHIYLLEVFKKKKDEPLPTPNSLGFHRYSRISTMDFAEILEIDVDEFHQGGETRYMEEFSCRELLLNDSNIWDDVFDEPQHNYIVGIRCYGEQHSTVSKLLQRNSDSKALIKNLIKEVFGICVDIKYGTLSQNLARRIMGNSNIIYGDGEKNERSYVTLYLNSWENLAIPAIDCGVSAILAILREPRIISGIINKQISDKRTLCKEIIKIAADRSQSLDDSYNCFSLVGITNFTSRTMTEIKKSIRYLLLEQNNDDGSDWFSIMNLAIFCYDFSNLSDYIYSGHGGPSVFVQEELSSDTLKRFKEFLGEDALLSLLRNAVLEDIGSKDYDFDDEDYSHAERRVESWANA